jgi:putative glycosyltransferase (TIGR04372 family)
MNDAQRMPHLDGLRGVASVMVLLNHLALCVIPSISTLRPDALASQTLIEIGRSPLSVAWGGDFGVCIFFVLSGFVLAQFAQAAGLRLPSMLARRYVRLALPMLASTLIGYFLLKIDAYRNLDVATTVSHSEWQALWYRFTPNLTVAIDEGLFGAFATGRSEYNCNLWTIQIELIGSAAIFLLYSLPARTRWRLGIVLVSLALLPGYYPLFAVGAALFELHRLAAPFAKKLRLRYREAIAAAMFLAAILAGGFPASGPRTGIVSPWHQWLSHSDNAQAWHMLGAMLMMVAVLYSQMLTSVLASRPGRILGRLSFPIYLVQIPLLCSLTSWLMISMASQPYVLMALAAIPVTVAATLAAADLLSRFVELPSLRLSRDIGFFLDNWLDRAKRTARRWAMGTIKPGGFDNLVFYYKQFVFQFIVMHCGGTTFVDRAIRDLMLRRPALFGLALRILRLKEFVDSNRPWHRPLSFASDQLIERWPRETAFLSLRIAAPDPMLGEPVEHWDDLTTTVAESLASAYFELGRFHRAREVLECAAVLGFRSPRFAYMLACLHLLDDDETEAVRWTIKAAELSPGLSAPSEYFSLTIDGPPYERTEFDCNNDDVAWLHSAYNYVGQRVLHVGEGQLRPACHVKSMKKQTMLRDRARPTPVLASFLKQTKIDFDTMHVLPWEWATHIGHLGMLEIMLRMRSLGWWNGHAILLTHAPKVANRVMLSLFEKFPDLTMIEDGYDDGAFRDPLAQELAALLRSHGLPYYAWRYPDERVVPWHEAGAHAIGDWEAQDRGYPLREVYDSSFGKDSTTLERAEEAFKIWGMSASDWYVCVHVREPSYSLEEASSGQNNRNASTANYEQALRYITDRGGWVIKLGAPSSPPLPAMLRVVDYARSAFKSELMDIHLIRHAKFFIGTTSGLANVAVSFGLPTAQVNCLTTEAQLWHSGVRFSLKPIYRSDGTMLSQHEITSTQWRWGLFTFDTMKRYGLYTIDNSPEEILETVKEVEALCDHRLAVATTDDRALIDAWRKCLPVPYHYGRSLPSIYFLRKFRGTFLP